MVAVEDGLSLGLMIRGGAEYGLGIYVTGVDESSAADIAGLQVMILKIMHKLFPRWTLYKTEIHLMRKEVIIPKNDFPTKNSF